MLYSKAQSAHGNLDELMGPAFLREHAPRQRVTHVCLCYSRGSFVVLPLWYLPVSKITGLLKQIYPGQL